MMKSVHVLLVTTVAMLAAACGGGSASQAGPAAAARPANVIAAEEIQREAGARNALELVRATRPNWLQGRGVQSLGSPGSYQGTGQAGGDVRRERGNPTRGAGEVVVYVDGTRAGTPDMLRQILASQVQEIRYLGGTEAASRFGTDHAAGALLVTLRR